MPVTLELISTPSQQDLLDLEKIYNDYPTSLRWPALQQQLADNPATRLYAGRFNNRLLGAITVRTDNASLMLENLCVRSITRQRNVARDILRLVMKQEAAAQYRVPVCQQAPGLEKLLTNAGFQRQGDTFVYTTDS